MPATEILPAGWPPHFVREMRTGATGHTSPVALALKFGQLFTRGEQSLAENGQESVRHALADAGAGKLAP